MADSKIEWTDSTWNPIRASFRTPVRDPESGAMETRVGWHCEHVTEACRWCYAEGMNDWRGTGLPYKPGHLDNGDIEVFLDEKTLLQPLSWKKPKKIFPCSMTDLFGRWVSDEWLDRIFAVMERCPHHTFIVLTKRPERMKEYLAGKSSFANWPLPNVWAGPSCSDQEDANRFIPIVLDTPLAKRIASLEPLLGRIDLFHIKEGLGVTFNALSRIIGLDWVIVGGESGSNARPFEINLARELGSQCAQVGVPFFMKQLGSKPMMHGFTSYPIRDRKGGDIRDFPEDLKVRQWPTTA